MRFAPRDLDLLFEELTLPTPRNVSAVLAALETDGLVSRSRGRGAVWALTPIGRGRTAELLGDGDLQALQVEGALSVAPVLGNLTHPLLPPALAPPEALVAIKDFLSQHPFESNVFGMTRFPETRPEGGQPDPVQPALRVAREVCAAHGLTFHLASDRALSDDLWTNVVSFMWASKFGIAFFEDRQDRGLNYNMGIEVGSMLMAGRRCALLRDTSVERMPTDLVGRIYKSVDLARPDSVGDELHRWVRDDLALGKCNGCPRHSQP